MKTLKKLLVPLLLLALSNGLVKAQEPVISISGHVYNKETGRPVANQAVVLSFDSTANYEYINKVITDQDGLYVDKIMLLPGMTHGKIIVLTFDCNGDRVSGSTEFHPEISNLVLDLKICGIQNSSCEAFFRFMSVADNALSVAFVDASRNVATSGKINYAWNFGDSTTSTEQNPVHTFKKSGTHNVCLLISSGDSACSSSLCLPVVVGTPMPGICQNSFMYHFDSISNEYVFEGLIRYGKADTWTWYFADGAKATGQKVTHTFNVVNSFVKVCLATTGTNSDGTICTSTTCRDIYTYDCKPCWNSFTYQSDSSGKVYTFEGIAASDKVSSWEWFFNDGTTTKGQKVTHTFSITNPNDIETVCLTTTSANPDGTVCSSTSCQQIKIKVPEPCQNSFRYQRDSSGNNYTFEGFSKNSQVVSWKWDFGDGTRATGQKVTHLFTNPYQVYNVCLTTKAAGPDGNTCQVSSCQNIFIDFKSECDNYFKTQTSDSVTYTFTSAIITGAAAKYYWDMGDGTTATGPQVTHTFRNEKYFYDVCLTTTVSMPGETGFSECKSISCQRINPKGGGLPCDAVMNVLPDNAKNTFRFQNLSPGYYNYAYWDFGDGSLSYDKNPVHTFASPGLYIVCLNIGDSIKPCFDQACKEIWIDSVKPECKALFSVKEAGPVTAASSLFMFFNTSAPGYSMQKWTFGDGTGSTEVNPIHNYLKPGIYMACLTISDSLNTCQDQSCQEIWVNMIQPECKASFYALPADPGIIDGSLLSFTFINSSSPGYTNQKWSFGDGTGSYDAKPEHTYANSGIYNVCLTIWDSLGMCKSNYCKDIYAGKVDGDFAISGIVQAGKMVADQGIVWLISPDNNYHAETRIDSIGMYHFTGVPHGKYYIYAMLTPGSSFFFEYMPTYYQGSLNWQGATLVTTGNSDMLYNISLVPSIVNNNQGNAAINGNVNWIDATGAPMSPAMNVSVVLFNSAGEPVAYTFTGNDGTYLFNNLPYGEYTIQAEMQGKTTQQTPVTLSVSSTNANINFRVNETAISYTVITTPTNSSISAGNPYPNPVDNYLYLDISVPVSGIANVEIINMHGYIIQHQVVELENGSNRISIKTNNLVKGVYQLRIKTPGQKPVQRRFIR